MPIRLHDSKSLYTKVLEVNHGLPAQDAITGRGRGEYTIIGGHPQIHNVILELLKIDIVWRVGCGDGYIMVTVSEPHRWKEIEGTVVHIASRNLDENAKD